ncbi:MAG: hypothetical protein LBK67_08280 [Coriobacteriales bacterium]|jgi:hypothetical protein|nr:hypothetical protein [Coriobacteriales bacterium]
MKRPTLFLLFLLFLLATGLLIALSGCNPSEPPKPKITAGDSELPYVIGLNKWNGSAYDKEDNFILIMRDNPATDMPYVASGETISIEFDGKMPDSVKLTDHILRSDGTHTFAVEKANGTHTFAVERTIDIDFSKGKGSFILDENRSASLGSSDDMFDASIRGFRLVCSWGDNECEYAFIIRSDPPMTSTGSEGTADDVLVDHMPDDFDFVLDYGVLSKNSIDTYNDTFTKDLVTNGTETISFAIPVDKMQELYAAFREYEISELPDDLNAYAALFIEEESMSTVLPASQFVLTYTCDNEIRTITYDAGTRWTTEDPLDPWTRLFGFVEVVCEYIYGTEEYQNMSPAEGGYL